MNELQPIKLTKHQIYVNFHLAHEGYGWAVENLLRHTIKLIRKIAGKKQTKVWTYEELEHVGILGFYRAIKSGLFDKNKGAWGTWIYRWISAAMSVEITQNETVIHIPNWRTYGENKIKFTFDPLNEFDCGKCSREVCNVEDADQLEVISSHFHRLTPRQAYILKEHIYGGRFFKDIAEDLGVTKQAVNLSYQRALGMLRSLAS